MRGRRGGLEPDNSTARLRDCESGEGTSYMDGPFVQIWVAPVTPGQVVEEAVELPHAGEPGQEPVHALPSGSNK